MSTETYETLHKKSVKNPYRMTNKKNYVPQMLNTVCYIIYLYHNLFLSISINQYIFKFNMIGTTPIFNSKTKIDKIKKI